MKTKVCNIIKSHMAEMEKMLGELKSIVREAENISEQATLREDVFNIESSVSDLIKDVEGIDDERDNEMQRVK